MKYCYTYRRGAWTLFTFTSPDCWVWRPMMRWGGEWFTWGPFELVRFKKPAWWV